MANRKRKVVLITLLSIFGALAVITAACAITVYCMVFKSNALQNKKAQYSLYIRDTTSFNTIRKKLTEDSVLIHPDAFVKYATWKKYPENIKSGRYIIMEGMSNKDIVSLLIAGRQTPVKVVFNSSKDIYTLAGSIAKQLSADSASIVSAYTNRLFLESLGLTPSTAYTMIIPNTYEFYWSADAEQFWRRMKKESDIFWEDRLKKAEAMDFSIEEVITLASIVERETFLNEDRPAIAGVYINRLNQKMMLQADPTLVFLADTGQMIRRVLRTHKRLDSPYNTYKYLGLPPGPIWIPSVSSIDAVLNYERHDYLFFCADPDMSGKSVFAKTYARHLTNARAYQNALNERKIFQ